MNVLIACEESQAVTIAFRNIGINAYSCDLLACSGGHPEWHFKGDVFKVIEKKGGTLQAGGNVELQGWDLMIAHPPCTYLAVSGARWFYHPDDAHLPLLERRAHPKFPNRRKDQDESVDLFLRLANANIPRIIIENPIGVISSLYRKPDQIVQPYYFGDEATKTTCLWFEGTEKHKIVALKHSQVVGKGERVIFKSGKSQPKWYSDALVNAKSTEERRTLRSKTFQGIADAMANQWGRL
jgi:hypothetical protein